MKRFFSIVLVLFLLVGFGTVFVNLCFTPAHSCHASNPYDDCQYKPTSTAEIAKIQIVPSFDFVSLLDTLIDKPIQTNKPSDLALMKQQFLEYSSFVKLLNPSNAPPLA